MTDKSYKISCNCKHEFQDKEYGKNIRVATPTTRTTETSRDIRCTVCASIKTVKK